MFVNYEGITSKSVNTFKYKHVNRFCIVCVVGGGGLKTVVLLLKCILASLIKISKKHKHQKMRLKAFKGYIGGLAVVFILI